MKPKTGYLEVDNAKLYYEIAGAGQPLVLIHAGVADSRQWDNEFEYYASKYRILRFDMRGYGMSEPVDGEYSHMTDLLAMLEWHSFRESIIMIGCSMGGSLAMDYAIASQFNMKALVMVGSGPSGLYLDVESHPKVKDAEEAYKAGDLDLVAELEAQIWFDGLGRSVQQVNQKMRSLALEMNRLALSHDAKKLGNRMPNTKESAFEQLDKLTIPILAIVGEYDEPYSQAAADYIREHVPSAKKVLLEDSAHLANMDHPEQFQNVVDSFLEEITV